MNVVLPEPINLGFILFGDSDEVAGVDSATGKDAWPFR
jgi:hypothetical protein